jgi:hypothetical protein
MILRAHEVLAKQCKAAGTLSGLIFDVQGSNNFAGIPYPAARNHPHALDDVRSKDPP